MREPNKKYIYDLSGLTSEEFKVLNKHLEKDKEAKWTSITFTTLKNESLYTLYWLNYGGWCLKKFANTQTINAKELFYTLENIQVDCSELTEGQVKEMTNVFEKKGYCYFENDEDYSLSIIGDTSYLHIYEGEIIIDSIVEGLKEITYDKFMELFGNKTELNRWYKHKDESLFYVTLECKRGNLYGYGFNREGSWKCYIDEGGYKCAFNSYAKNYKTPATKEEVEERLTQEAIKRGFNVGYESGKYVYLTHDKDWYLDSGTNSFFVRQKDETWSTIMEDGVWLESKLPPYKETPLKWTYGTLVGGTETTDEVSPISSREKELKKTLKYLLKKGIILTPKQYKKLWKGL